LSGAEAQIHDNTNAPDIFLDLNVETLPFENDSCIEVRCSHFLEHSNVDHIIKESFRVMKANGFF
jgi:ubiquinone/menaquinone biosynthesis C-methylase UbiE